MAVAERRRRGDYFLKADTGSFGDGEPIFSEGPWGGFGPLLGVAQDHIDPRNRFG